MNNCEFLKARGPPKAKANTLTNESKNLFDGPEDATIVHEVQTLLTNLIGDEDISIAVGIKETDLAKSEDPSCGEKMDAVEIIKSIVACTAVVDPEETKTLLDEGILRYPDITQPYVSVYRIRLEPNRACTSR